MLWYNFACFVRYFKEGQFLYEIIIFQNRPRIDVDYISIRHFRVGSICNRHRSEGLCYLRSVTIIYDHFYSAVCLKNVTQRCGVKSFSISITMTTIHISFMMTSSNGNISRVTGHLCGEFTGHRWIPSTKAGDAELWCFLWSASE